MLKKFTITTNYREEMIDITAQLIEFIKSSKIDSGIANIFVPHTTAGVTINENADSDVVKDIISFEKTLIPKNNNFRHIEGNSDAHIKTTFTGPSLNVIIEKNKPLLGTWQGVWFCEFDGPRTRNFYIKLLKD
jgi:secondary thiamine-phosphate synthase enzyme